MQFLRRFFGRLLSPPHSAESVARALIDGLRDGTITLDGQPEQKETGETIRPSTNDDLTYWMNQLAEQLTTIVEANPGDASTTWLQGMHVRLSQIELAIAEIKARIGDHPSAS